MIPGNAITAMPRKRKVGTTISPRIDRNTAVIVQGITGRAGRMHARLMREYGTRIVGGVSPKSAVADVDGVPVPVSRASSS